MAFSNLKEVWLFLYWLVPDVDNKSWGGSLVLLWFHYWLYIYLFLIGMYFYPFISIRL